VFSAVENIAELLRPGRLLTFKASPVLKAFLNKG
jgi:hypothetical protein